QRVRLVLEPRLAASIVATRDRADDAVGAREERLERRDGDEPLAAREERSHVAVALGVDDDALAVLGVADALSGGERNGSAHQEILGWCRPTYASPSKSGSFSSDTRMRATSASAPPH